MTSLASRPRLRVVAILTLLLVPLAVVGLFAGALSGLGSKDSRVPAAIVNQDRMVQQTAEDGTTTPVLAGRLLVTQLTGHDPVTGAADAFDWRITSKKAADAALARGDVYAVLTIPKNFSASIVSLSTASPQRGTISIGTDDAHGYLAGTLTNAVGDGMAAVFGDAISQKFIAGLVGGTGQFKDAFTQSADGAAKLETGIRGIATALGALKDGASATQQGAAELSSGIDSYTGGVGSLASSLDQLRDSSAGIQQLPQGVTDYSGGVSRLATGLAGVVTQLNAAAQARTDPAVPLTLDQATLDQLNALSTQLTGAAGAGPDLVAGAQGAASAQSAIGILADAADRLDGGSSSLSGATASLNSGLTSLTSGLDSAATGTGTLGDGTGNLATGLTTAAHKVPTYTADQTKQISDVAASPIQLTTVRRHEVTDVPGIASTLLVPVGLWIGAFTVFLALGLLTRRVFASTASNLRITGYALTRGGAVVLAQALLLVALLHGAIHVPWSALPATLPFSLLIAVVVTCIHALLTAAFGRWGLILSLVLLALQLTATGGLYPIQLVAAPFRVISPVLPVTEAVTGMQAILAGVGPGPVIAAALPLVVWAVVTAALTVFAVSRKRSARYLGLVPAPTRPVKVHAHLAA